VELTGATPAVSSLGMDNAIIGIMLILGLIVLLRLVFNEGRPLGKGRDEESESPLKDYRPPPPGPGMYLITGVDKATKMDTTWRVNAQSAENARVKAELEGIIVTSIKFESP